MDKPRKARTTERSCDVFILNTNDFNEILWGKLGMAILGLYPEIFLFSKIHFSDSFMYVILQQISHFQSLPKYRVWTNNKKQTIKANKI